MTRNMPNLFIFVTPFGRNYVVEWLGERIGRRELPPEFLEVKGRLFQFVALVALRDQVVKFRQLGGFAVKVKMFFFVAVRAVNRQSEKSNLHCSSSFFKGSGQAASRPISWNVSR